MNQIYASATTSASHIYGNVAKSLEMFLTSHLPSGLLKETVVSTSVAIRGFRKWRNTKKDWGRMVKPFMVIRPTFTPLDSDSFLENTRYTRHEGTEIHNSHYGVQTFLKDDDRGFKLGFKINRNRMEFDVMIYFDTMYKMLDTYHFLKNMMRWEIPDYLNTSLESMIPKNILNKVGEVIGLDISKEENIATMIKYLRTYSTYPITYKMRNSTSRDEYFLLYRQNILTTFSDLSMDEGSKKNMADDFYTLSFKATCDFNTMGTYLMIGDSSMYKQIQFSIANDLDSDIDLGSFSPIYTYDISENVEEFAARGYRPMLTNLIKTEPALHGKDDSVNIRCFFEDNFITIMRNVVAQELDPRILIETKIYKDMDEQRTDADFTIDWGTFNITIHNTNKYATYRLVLFVNLAYLNNRLMELENTSTDQQTMSGGSINGYDT